MFLALASSTQELVYPVAAQSTDNANISHNFVELYSITSFSSTRSVAVGKCHPDEVPRIILGNYDDGTIRILSPSGSNYILEAELFLSPGSSDTFEPFLVYDFDEDGLPEILGNLQGNGAFIGWNGIGYSRKWETEGNLINFDGAPQVCDIDRDGNPELISNTRTSTYIYSWNSGFTNFQQDVVLAGGAWFEVGIGDIDKDGEDEIITSCTPVLHVYGYNEGSYEEEYQRPYSNKDYSAFSVVDIDNDQDLEIIGGLANVGAPNHPITLFEWNGVGLDLYNITYSPLGHFDTHAGDIDGDGLPEVLIEGNGGQFIVVDLASNGTVIAKDYYLNCNVFYRLYDFNDDSIQEVVTTELVYRDDISLPPALINVSSSSITIEQNSNINYNVSWTPIDRQSLTYSLYWEGTKFIGPVGCFSGKLIKYNLFSRTDTIGTFNLTLIVNDTDLNKANHSVFITVVSPEPPIISNVESSPVNPNPGENITISANITDLSGIFSATLHYNIDSGAVIDVPLQWKNGDIYQVEIGSFIFGQVIRYSISAIDNTPDQNVAIDDNSGSDYSFEIVDTISPTITNVYHSPSDPIVGDSISVYADIEDASAITTAELYFQVNSDEGWTSMSMAVHGGTTHHVNIGSFSEDTEIRYYIKANDGSDNEAINDNEGNYYSIYIPRIPESSTEQTSTSVEPEETSEEKISSESSEAGQISISAPINLTGLELVLLIIGTVFYRKNKLKD